MPTNRTIELPPRAAETSSLNAASNKWPYFVKIDSSKDHVDCEEKVIFCSFSISIFSFYHMEHRKKQSPRCSTVPGGI